MLLCTTYVRPLKWLHFIFMLMLQWHSHIFSIPHPYKFLSLKEFPKQQHQWLRPYNIHAWNYKRNLCHVYCTIHIQKGGKITQVCTHVNNYMHTYQLKKMAEVKLGMMQDFSGSLKSMRWLSIDHAVALRYAFRMAAVYLMSTAKNLPVSAMQNYNLTNVP